MAAHRKFNDSQKYCPGCEKWLPLVNFSRAKRTVSKLRSRCKECESVLNSRMNTRRRRQDIRWGLLKNAKQRAKAFNVPFNLTESDVYAPMVCPVLGIPIKYGRNFTDSNSPSLDRAIPELGYVRGNVFIISMRANAIKNDATVSDLEKVLKYTRLVQGPHA